VFADIISELRTQYVLGFYPRNVPLTKNPFHKLEVRVKSPDLRPSYRQGYYGDVEGGPSEEAARPTVNPERKKPETKKKDR
jgi:Ca-activated chloride channel family protein